MFGGKLNKIDLKIYFILIIIILCAIFLNLFPNYYAYLKTPTGYIFSGQASWFDPWDINIYVSTIKLGQTGNILFQNLYTSLPNTPILLYPLYTISGYLVPNLNPFLIYYLLSSIFSIFLVIVLWILANIFLSKYYSLLAVFLVTFGGGLGWLFFPNFQSADLYMTGFTFTSQFQRAHEALGVSLYLIALSFFYLATVKKKFIFNLITIIALIFLCFIYPYNIISFFVISVIFSLFYQLRTTTNTQFKYWMIDLIVITPIIYLYYNHLQINPTLISILTQKLPTPNILELFCGWGILVFIFLIQFKIKTHLLERLFLNIWLIVSFLLSYAPFGFARFYLRGLFFPLVLLSIYGLEYLIYKYPKKRIVFILILIILVPLSSIFIYFKRIEEIPKYNPWFYINRETVDLLNLLPKNSSYQKTIMTDYQMGNIIPVFTKYKVFFGHLIQTPDAKNKINQIERFYNNYLSDEDALSFLKKERIDYIYFENNNLLKYKFLRVKNSNEGKNIYSY